MEKTTRTAVISHPLRPVVLVRGRVVPTPETMDLFPGVYIIQGPIELNGDENLGIIGWKILNLQVLAEEIPGANYLDREEVQPYIDDGDRKFYGDVLKLYQTQLPVFILECKKFDEFVTHRLQFQLK